MRVVPRDKPSQLSFFQGHVSTWAERAAELGLTEDEVALLEARVVAANEAYAAQREAQRVARAATTECDAAMAAMAELGASLIHQIRATAVRGGPTVYARACLPTPESPSPVGAPGVPYAFTTELRNEGALLLRWRCEQPRGAEGTMYKVWRSVDGGAFAFLDVVGKRRFLDLTLPPGTAQAVYQVQAVRSTRVGPVETHTVNLGVPAGHPAAMQVAA